MNSFPNRHRATRALWRPVAWREVKKETTAVLPAAGDMSGMQRAGAVRALRPPPPWPLRSKVDKALICG